MSQIKDRAYGHIYIVEFSNGTLKAGSARTPVERRIKAHRQNATALGLTVLRTWVSPLHMAPLKTEAELLRRLKALATGVPRREYFVGVPFARAVEEAETMAFPVETDDERTARLASARQKDEAFAEFVIRAMRKLR